MKYKKILLIIVILAALIITAIKFDDTRDVFRKFISHIDSTYLIKVMDNLSEAEKIKWSVDPSMSAKLFGYALNMQLKYCKRDTSEHRIWQMLERRCKSALEDEIADVVVKINLNDQETKNLRKRVMWEFEAAMLGVHDMEMAHLSKINPGNVPNFFVSLREANEQVQTNNQNVNRTDINNTQLDTDQQIEQDRQRNTDEELVPGFVGDEILGRWTYFHEQTIHRKLYRQKYVVVVQKAGREVAFQTGRGPRYQRLYEGYLEEVEVVGMDTGYKRGQLIWKIRFLEPIDEPDEKQLGYTMNSLYFDSMNLDKPRWYGDFTIYLHRQEGKLKAGQSEWFR